MRIQRLVSEQAPRYHITDGDKAFWVDDDINELMRAVRDPSARVEEAPLNPHGPQLVPVSPSKIVCVGLNYACHAREMNKPVPEHPLLFMKPPSSLLPPGGTIELPPHSSLVHHEAELAIIIGTRAKDVPQDLAMNHVLGYTCANDVTARDIQRKENRYTRGKGFDTFCPLGPVIVTAQDFDLKGVRVQCRVNGEVRQDGTLDDLLVRIEGIVSFISEIMTLMPGDVILTGTPMGVGELKNGDQVEVEVSGIGVLRNHVAAKV